MLLKLLSFILLGIGTLSLSVADVPEAWSTGVPETQIAHEQLPSFVGGSTNSIRPVWDEVSFISFLPSAKERNRESGCFFQYIDFHSARQGSQFILFR